jgi:hypothetical protein
MSAFQGLPPQYIQMMMEDMKSDPLAELGTYDPNRVEECGGYTSKETCKDIEFPEFGGKMECMWKENKTTVERCEEKCGVPTRNLCTADGCEWSEDEYRCRLKDENVRNLDTDCWGFNKEDPNGGDEWALFDTDDKNSCREAKNCEIIKETGYCTQAEQCEYQTEKSKCNKETVGRECKWVSSCAYLGPQDPSDESCQMIGDNETLCKIAEMSGKCQWDPSAKICNNYDCSCKTVDNCLENKYCGFSEQDGNCMNIDAKPGVSLNQCNPPPSIDCYAKENQSIEKCVNGINEQYCAWTTECSTNTDPTNKNFKQDCKECALLSNDPKACKANIKCKITDPKVGFCQNKNVVTDEGLTAPCDMPMVMGAGPKLGRGAKEEDKSICFNRKLETECKPLNEKYLGEGIDLTNIQHTSRCEWVGNIQPDMTTEEKMGVQSQHFCENEAFLKCQRYIADAEECNNAGCVYDQNQYMCLPKGYVFGQDKCKLVNNESIYDQKKSKCNPDDGCRWVDGFCKVWEPEVTTAATRPLATTTVSSGTGSGSGVSREIPPVITEPPVKRKQHSDELKNFSEETGCLLYNEEAPEKIQCKPSNVRGGTPEDEPEITAPLDKIPVYSADGKLNESVSPFHQLREAELILNKI